MSSARASGHRDDGAGSVLALAVVLVVLLVGTCGVALGGLSVARQQAQASADQAALAAAATGECARAEALAAANGTRLLECRWVGPDVVVGVAAPVPVVSRWLVALAAPATPAAPTAPTAPAPGSQPPWSGGPGAIAASARAGPAD